MLAKRIDTDLARAVTGLLIQQIQRHVPVKQDCCDTGLAVRNGKLRCLNCISWNIRSNDNMV